MQERVEGVLRLKLVRSGEVKDVAITLEVLGTYSKTAPADCAKSRKILDDARAYVVEQMGADGDAGLCGAASGLLLLSSGDPKHLDPVRRIVRRILPNAMKLKPEGPNAPSAQMMITSLTGAVETEFSNKPKKKK